MASPLARPNTKTHRAPREKAKRTENYRGWVIKYDPPPVPFRNCDWAFVHRDFDGAPDAGDHRYGHAASVVEAKAAIDSLIEDEQ